MATTKQSQTAARGAKKARQTVATKKNVQHVRKDAAMAIGKRGSAALARGTRGSAPMTRTELYALAKQRDLPGRSKMGRDELAKALGMR